MNNHRRLLDLAALRLMTTAVLGCILFALPATAAEAQHPKNWTPPGYKMYGQKLCDDIMAAHPELISVTFHGVPPGRPPGTYTMFAGSFPDRIGNVDDPDDVMVSEKGITILDPRWHKTQDPIAKFVVMMPLRTADAENIGLIVLAYHNPPNMNLSAGDFLRMATSLRDNLQFRIKSLDALFQRD